VNAPVVVVGAGPVGIVAATLLAQRGVARHVVDRRRAAHPLPRAVHLDGAAVRVLQEAGWPRSSPASAARRRGCACSTPGTAPSRWSSDRRSGPTATPRRACLTSPLSRRCCRPISPGSPQVSVERGSELTDVDAAGVTLRDVRTGSARRCPAAVVLGCDGAGSTVGSVIGAGWRELGAPQGWFVVDVRCRQPLPSWGGIDQVCDPRRAATFLHLTGDRYRFEFQMLDGEAEADVARPGLLGTLTKPWLGGLPEASWTVVRSAAYTFARAQRGGGATGAHSFSATPPTSPRRSSGRASASASATRTPPPGGSPSSCAVPQTRPCLTTTSANGAPTRAP
jgi:3-(3-hydroxy-phenyl)propionate hydroxylase